MDNGDMDVDMDIDLGSIDAVESVDVSQPSNELALQSNGTPANATITTLITDSESSTPHKIHIRGVDDLTTDDIKAFSIEHFPSDPPVRIEWIDDTSANIVYNTPGTGLTALENLSIASSSAMSLAELRPAKSSSTHPGSTLQVRTALTSDQKRPRAYEASRFYMMHPEHDPREQRRRDRSHHTNGDYQRRRYGDDENRRRRRKDKESGFDASMYDDNASTSRRGSFASSSDDRARRPADSYRPHRNGESGSSRDRSASPDRQKDERSRRRKRTPPPSYRSRDPHPFPTENEGKELFPTKAQQGNEKAGKELFSDRMVTGEPKKELFPQKSNIIMHRRSDAFDMADETADLFSSGMSVPFADGPKRAAKGLGSRITAPAESTYGRLKSSDPEPQMDEEDDGGLTIRGASRQDQGFSIRGGAAAGTIKELFPSKAVGNAGKELFAERLEGRGGRRNRAEDMFY